MNEGGSGAGRKGMGVAVYRAGDGRRKGEKDKTSRERQVEG